MKIRTFKKMIHIIIIITAPKPSPLLIDLGKREKFLINNKETSNDL